MAYHHNPSKPMAGMVQLWSYSCNTFPAPADIGGVQIQGTSESSAKETAAKTWFQGHLFTAKGNQQYAVLGVPAQAPPPIHGCMVSEHDTPSYYDIFLTEYQADGSPKIALCALNVERSGGSGDAIEMQLMERPTAPCSLPPGVLVAEKLRLSTTRMISGQRAWEHLTKYAPDALAQAADEDIVVCLGVFSAQ